MLWYDIVEITKYIAKLNTCYVVIVMWIYLLIFISLILLLLIYNFGKVKVIRVFGCELLGILLCILALTLLIGEILVPMPQYYIKHQGYMSMDTSDRNKFSLNKILEKEALKSGIQFDPGSFRILDSHGMHFNHLFLCSYQVDGKEEVRVVQFEKNIFGNMRPKCPFNEAYIIPRDGNNDTFYRVYVRDGIFGGYLVTAGFASEDTVLENYQLNNFRMEKIHPSPNYFMWVELVSEPWKFELIKVILLAIFIFISGKIVNQNREPIKFYSKWRIGDKIFQCIKED
jgi:hypothetical protein